MHYLSSLRWRYFSKWRDLVQKEQQAMKRLRAANRSALLFHRRQCLLRTVKGWKEVVELQRERVAAFSEAVSRSLLRKTFSPWLELTREKLRMKDVADTFRALRGLDLQVQIFVLWRQAVQLRVLERAGDKYALVVLERVKARAFLEWSALTRSVAGIRERARSIFRDMNQCLMGEAVDLWRRALVMRRERMGRIQEALAMFQRNRGKADLSRFLEDATRAVRERDEELAREAASKAYFGALAKLQGERERILAVSRQAAAPGASPLKLPGVSDTAMDLRPSDLAFCTREPEGARGAEDGEGLGRFGEFDSRGGQKTPDGRVPPRGVPAAATAAARANDDRLVEEPTVVREYVVAKSRRAPRTLGTGAGDERDEREEREEQETLGKRGAPETREAREATSALGSYSRPAPRAPAVLVGALTETPARAYSTGAAPLPPPTSALAPSQTQFSEKEVLLLRDCVDQYTRARRLREELRERRSRLIEEAGTLRAELSSTATPAALGLQLEALALEIEELQQEEEVQASTVAELKQVIRRYKDAI